MQKSVDVKKDDKKQDKDQNKNLFKKIGPRIKESRSIAGLTQEQLAEYIDVSSQYISDLERGKVGTSIPTIIKICKATHASADYILFGRKETTYESDILNCIVNLSPSQRDLTEQAVRIVLEAFATNLTESDL